MRKSETRAMGKRAVQPIARKSIVESIADRLRERILNGDFRDGDALRQDAIARAYAVSRMPVREALRQLEAEGLAVFHAHRGAIVSGLQSAEIEELFDLRVLVEPDLIRHAAPLATENDIRACKRALAASEAAFDSRNVARWGEANWKLHEAMYRPAQRVRSLAFVQTLNFQIDRYLRIQLSLTDAALERAKSEHRELFEAYAKGSGAQAAKLLKAHLVAARDALMGALGK